MIPKRPRFRPIALLCALSAALVLYAGCFSSVTGDEDVSGTVAAGGSSGNAGGNAPDDPKNEAGSAACVIGGSRLESFTAADLSKEEFGDTYTIQLVGKWTDDDLTSLGTELKKITGKHITLDMAQATGIESIVGYAFEDCTSLASVTIPEGVTTIERYAFHGCTSLASVTIPEGVTTIGSYAFHGCTSLASVTIPAGVTSIDIYAFWGCTNLTVVTIPASVESIRGGAFYGCTSLASVTIPAGVTSIGINTFWKCTSLASVTIPAGVESIGSGAFYDCPSLASITFTGTAEQWKNRITKGEDWHYNVPATKVTCTGGGTPEDADLD